MVAAEHARTAASTDMRALEIDGEQYELYTSLVGAMLQMMRRYLAVRATAEQLAKATGTGRTRCVGERPVARELA